MFTMKKLLLFIFVIALMLSGCAGKDQKRRGDVTAAKGQAAVSEKEKSTAGMGDLKEDTSDPASESITPENKHIHVSLPDSGYDVFTPDTPNVQDYRYGPSILRDKNGRMNVWGSCPGNGQGEFDWISYRYSDDDGKTWSDEKLVLRPTPSSLDSLSVCDPDVFYYDGYYYMGYTSTIDDTANGLCNSVFIARSEKPDGPYEKWTGEGWGTYSCPMIYYNGPFMGWGCGEPSFVVKDDTVYVYTTRDSYTKDYERIKCTEIRTGDLKDQDWVKHLEFQGTAVIRTENGEDAEYEFKDCDSWDVSYVEEAGMFAAFCVNRRFDNDSCILYYESPDGFNFERVSEINTNVICGCHNCGISGDENAHIKKNDPVFLGYSYSGSRSSSWGVWAMRMAEAVIDITDHIDRSDEENADLKAPIAFGTGHGQGFEEPEDPGTVLTENRNLGQITNLMPFFTRLDLNMSQQYAVAIRPVARFEGGHLSELSLEEIAAMGMTFDVKNGSVCSVREDCVIIPHAPGGTIINVTTPNGLGFSVYVTVEQ